MHLFIATLTIVTWHGQAHTHVIYVNFLTLLEHILFETGQDILLVESFKSLDDLVKKLKAMDDYHVEIQGHTDNTGALDTNLELSRKRAQAVVEYLVSKGVPRSKVQAKGFGSSAPKYDNDTEDGRRKNRRVECSITHRH